LLSPNEKLAYLIAVTASVIFRTAWARKPKLTAAAL
jgi:hypothetical protein